MNTNSLDKKTELHACRTQKYRERLESLGVDAAVLSSDASIRHLTGVHLYTQNLIPERPIVAVLGDAGTSLVCCTYETSQVERQAPHLIVRPFAELVDDPWRIVADELRRMFARPPRVLIETTCPHACAIQLAASGCSVIIDSDQQLAALRTIKEPAEIALMRELSQAADHAVNSACEIRLPQASEAAVAEHIASTFRRLMQRYDGVQGLCVNRRNNGLNHHAYSLEGLGEGPIRLGVKGRSEGFWILLTRMALGHRDAAFMADYAAYLSAYMAGIAEIAAGAPANAPYKAVGSRLAQAGLVMRSKKVGHGTGLGFREPPVLEPRNDSPLESGTVLAYDFSIEPASTRSGLLLHIEDRLLVTDSGAERLSSISDLAEPLRMEDID